MTPTSSNIPQALIGFWKIVGGDYPLINEYRTDGVRVQHVGAQTSDPMRIRVEGNCLITVLDQEDGTATEDREQFEISGDRLSFINLEGEKREFQRVSGTEQVAGGQNAWWKFWWGRSGAGG